MSSEEVSLVFELFTDQSRQSVLMAQEYARWNDSPSIDTIHLLMGLISRDSLIKDALADLGMDQNDMEAFIKINIPAVRPQQRYLPFSDDLHATFNCGFIRSGSGGTDDTDIWPIHLLHGLLDQAVRGGSSTFAAYLAFRGFSPEGFRRYIERKFS